MSSCAGSDELRRYAKYVVSFGVTFPGLAIGLGLGELKVNSFLNQPLKAYIKLTLPPDTPLDAIKVKLASPEAFQRAGLQRPYLLSQLTFALAKRQGEPVIKINSRSRVEEPYLQLLLDVAWADGQLYRAYTVLLDPPDYQVVKTSSSYLPKKIAPVGERAGTMGDTRHSAIKPLVPITSPSTDSVVVYGLTSGTDDLWRIALKYKPAGVTLDQMMLTIVAVNPKSFVGGNINGLKKGVKLTIPSQKRIIEIFPNPQQAKQEVIAHNQAWQGKTSIAHVINVDTSHKEAPEAIADPFLNKPVMADMGLKESSLKNEIKLAAEKADRQALGVNEALNTNEQEQPKQVKAHIETAHSASITHLEKADREQSATPVAKDKEIRIIPKNTAKNEKLFDDFIPIPQVLTKIVKKPKDNVDNVLAAKMELNENTDEKEITNQQQLKNLEVERQKNLNAEMAVATSAIASVKESNELLRQQVQTLIEQNTLLKQQALARQQQQTELQQKIALLASILDKEFVLSSDGQLLLRSKHKEDALNTVNHVSLVEIISVFLFLLAIASGAGLAYLYYRHQQTRWTTTEEAVDEEVTQLNKEKQTELTLSKEEERASKGMSSQAIYEQPATNHVKQHEATVSFASASTPSTLEANNCPEKMKVPEGNTNQSNTQKKGSNDEAISLPITEEVALTNDLLKNDNVLHHENSISSTASTSAEVIEEKMDIEPSASSVSTTNEDDNYILEFDKTQEPSTKEPHIDNGTTKNSEEEADPFTLDFEPGLSPRLAELKKEAPTQEDADVAETASNEVVEPMSLSLEEPEAISQNSSTGEQEHEKPADEPITKGINMSTQLALAETYLAMEDWESAKSCLEEVIAGGTSKQIERAKQLLKNLTK